MQHYEQPLLGYRNGQLKSVTDATISVTVPGTPATLAVIYNDNGVTPKSNPFSIGAGGTISFWAANGKYDIRTDSPLFGTTTLSAVVLFDPADGGGSGASAFSALTDAATANLPATNAPLATALAAKADATSTTAALAAKADASALIAGLAAKADASAMATALAAKADSSTTTAALAAKADTSAMTTALAAKADTSAMTTALAGKAPASNIALTALASAVQTSLGKADTALQTAPVTTVAGRAGAITLTKSDVSLGSVDNTADAAKPISVAQAAALAGKADAATMLASLAAKQPLAPIVDLVMQFGGGPTMPIPQRVKPLKGANRYYIDLTAATNGNGTKDTPLNYVPPYPSSNYELLFKPGNTISGFIDVVPNDVTGPSNPLVFGVYDPVTGDRLSGPNALGKVTIDAGGNYPFGIRINHIGTRGGYICVEGFKIVNVTGGGNGAILVEPAVNAGNIQVLYCDVSNAPSKGVFLNQPGPGCVVEGILALNHSEPGIVERLAAAPAVRASSTAYSLHAKVTWSYGTTVWQVTAAGTSASTPPSIVGIGIGGTVTDGTVVWTLRSLVNVSNTLYQYNQSWGVYVNDDVNAGAKFNGTFAMNTMTGPITGSAAEGILVQCGGAAFKSYRNEVWYSRNGTGFIGTGSSMCDLTDSLYENNEYHRCKFGDYVSNGANCVIQFTRGFEIGTRDGVTPFEADRFGRMHELYGLGNKGPRNIVIRFCYAEKVYGFELGGTEGVGWGFDEAATDCIGYGCVYVDCEGNGVQFNRAVRCTAEGILLINPFCGPMSRYTNIRTANGREEGGVSFGVSPGTRIRNVTVIGGTGTKYGVCECGTNEHSFGAEIMNCLISGAAVAGILRDTFSGGTVEHHNIIEGSVGALNENVGSLALAGTSQLVSIGAAGMKGPLYIPTKGGICDGTGGAVPSTALALNGKPMALRPPVGASFAA